MKSFLTNKTSLLFFSIITGGLFFAQAAIAQELPARTENCNNLLQWFTIQFDSGATTSAVGGLPIICTAQGGISWFINLLLLFAGSVAVIFIIIGGFRYLTSAGNEEASEQGKKTLVTSVIGLVVIILAATIVRIVATTVGIGQPKSNNDAPAANGQPAASEASNPTDGWRQATPEEIEANNKLQQQGSTPR